MNPLHIYPHYFRFFPLVSHYRVLTRIACAIWQILISYLHSSVYVNPHLPVYTSPPSPGNHSLFSKSVIHSTSQFSSVQSLSQVRLFPTPWIAAHQDFLSITNFLSLLKPMSIESVMPSSHLILCRPLLLLPPVPPSIRVFSNESTLHQVAKVLEFQLQHQSFQWTPRTDLL